MKALEYLGSLCNTVLGALKTAFPLVFGVPGLLAGASTLLGSFIYSLFQDWTIGSTLTQLVGYATQAVNVLSGAVDIGSPIAQNILAFVAADSLASYFLAALAATVGVVVFVFATIAVMALPLLSAVLVVRFTLKIVRVCSGGLVDP